MLGKLFNGLKLHFLQKPGTVIGLLLICLVTTLNPFGLRDATDQNLEAWLLRMLAPFYSEKGQEDVVVVLIDDQALASMNATWPLRYSDQARMLRQLISHEPKAVFVDLLYTQKRHDGGSTESLLRALQSAQQRGVPLILADHRDSQGLSQLLPELNGLAHTAQVNWSGYGERYPLLLEGAESLDLRTPAMQLYQAGCAGAECDIGAFRSPLMVRWGYWSDPQMASFVDLEGCSVRGKGNDFMQLFAMLGAEMTRSQQDQDQVDRPQPCPYSRTIYANQLRDPQVSEVLRGKYVLLGASIQGVPDLVTSPVQGQLPGVYWHAMALDNLLTQGQTYWRSAPDTLGNISVTDLLEMFLILLAGIAALYIPEKAPTGAGLLRSWSSHYRFWFFLLTTLTAFISFSLVHYRHYALLDWLGLLLVIAIFYGYLAEPRVAQWWEEKWKEEISRLSNEESKDA